VAAYARAEPPVPTLVPVGMPFAHASDRPYPTTQPLQLRGGAPDGIGGSSPLSVACLSEAFTRWRGKCAAAMTPAEIAAGRKGAREWKPKYGRMERRIGDAPEARTGQAFTKHCA